VAEPGERIRQTEAETTALATGIPYCPARPAVIPIAAVARHPQETTNLRMLIDVS